MFTALDANAWVSNLPSTSGASIVDGSISGDDIANATIGKAKIANDIATHSALTSTYAGITAARVAPFARARGAVVFTWDDGYTSCYTEVRSRANSMGQKHTFFINSSKLGLTQNSGTCMTESQVLDLYNDGHEIGHHTVNHLDLTAISAGQRLTEYDTAGIDAVIGAGNIKSLAEPYGNYDATVLKELAGRFGRVFTLGQQPYRVDHRNFYNVRRYIWDSTARLHAQVLQAIRLAAEAPVIVVICGHDPGQAAGSSVGSPTLSQLTEAMTLANTLGVPCLTAAEAFPTMPQLADMGFEDPDLGPWRTISNTGSPVATVASVVDTPDTNMPGARSLKISATDAATVCCIGQQAPVIPGIDYTFAARVRVAGTSGAGTYRLRITQLGTGSLTQPSSSAITSTSWTTASVTLTAQATAHAFQLEFLVNGMAGDFYADHVWFGPTSQGSGGYA
jgi:peptidoglycan/xylan/chitin deacetylase (PgdA/CDA1 family)